MAALSSPSLILSLSLMTILFSRVHSLNCTSQKFTSNKLYANCTDLPSLASYLHWTYHPANSTLYIAFLAPPAHSDGWIAWAINPTGTGMAGAQSLIAFKDSNGSMTVKTYNISSYTSIVQSKILYDVLDSSAENSGGLMKIFATLALPKNMAELNQVWQVGSSVTKGMPDKHAFQPANLMAKGKLELTKAQVNGTIAPAPSPSATAPTSPAPSGGNSGAGLRFRNGNVGLCVISLFLGGSGFWL
ncbi:hypothetical protein RJ639_018285 [Escallonia herrerae]|uniref:DOMON domain-containing protein n=1 Tax=Escallonia herrerae TaxID=1293975 RepID=A0AA88VCZ1_9ASTE|nr:hypothetical protein RJ639_018285 [Escallonia herrerae]